MRKIFLEENKVKRKSRKSVTPTCLASRYYTILSLGTGIIYPGKVLIESAEYIIGGYGATLPNLHDNIIHTSKSMDVIDRATYKVLSNQKLLYCICEEDAYNENKIFCKLFLIDGAENFVLKVL